MSSLKRFFLIFFTIFIVSSSGFLFWVSSHYVVPIMMYHNVNYTDEPKPNTVSPENFARHMAYLRENGYHVMSMDEFVQMTTEGRKFSRKSVVITFDDGYEDNYSYAFDILQKHQLPAIIFIPSDLMDAKGYLYWGQIQEMVENGVDFGSHTRFHKYLPDLSFEEKRDEIVESKKILEENLGVEIKHFAYPIGGFSEQIKRLVKEAGYQSASATNRGYDRKNEDVFELNRIRFGDKDSDFVLWAKLSGYYNLFRSLKSPY
ncbi:hypothetical protein MNBD_UNCLBAC01-398 [hydrothermal vent metagenome]|uniref:NodB homology domain-containing protein n=1 Tax=hydrothermal vent metagenome TaxID=652676 RepID=A0A3B1DMG1_9ZZZZ